MINELHLYSASLTSDHSKLFTMLPYIHPFTHTLTHRRRCQPRRATASSSGAVRVRRLAQGHLTTRLGGAWDRTSNLPLTSHHALPPEPRAAPVLSFPESFFSQLNNLLTHIKPSYACRSYFNSFLYVLWFLQQPTPPKSRTLVVRDLYL